jgi:type II secretory pathway component PulJ
MTALDWATTLAVLGLLVSFVVGVYTARSNRKSARETAELANWPAMVQALETEVARLRAMHNGDSDEIAELNARVTALERDNKDGPGRSS